MFISKKTSLPNNRWGYISQTPPKNSSHPFHLKPNPFEPFHLSVAVPYCINYIRKKQPQKEFRPVLLSNIKYGYNGAV